MRTSAPDADTARMATPADNSPLSADERAWARAVFTEACRHCPGPRPRLLILNAATPNAASAPLIPFGGGLVIVTRGAIRGVDASGLAAVYLHEIGHNRYLHGVISLLLAEGTLWLTNGTLHWLLDPVARALIVPGATSLLDLAAVVGISMLAVTTTFALPFVVVGALSACVLEPAADAFAVRAQGDGRPLAQALISLMRTAYGPTALTRAVHELWLDQGSIRHPVVWLRRVGVEILNRHPLFTRRVRRITAVPLGPAAPWCLPGPRPGSTPCAVVPIRSIDLDARVRSEAELRAAMAADPPQDDGVAPFFVRADGARPYSPAPPSAPRVTRPPVRDVPRRPGVRRPQGLPLDPPWCG